jgi:hypothetical protein
VSINHDLHPVFIGRHDDVSEQGQTSLYRRKLLGCATTFRRDQTMVDRSLHTANGLALIEKI